MSDRKRDCGSNHRLGKANRWLFTEEEAIGTERMTRLAGS